jgi:hypothetical protein
MPTAFNVSINNLVIDGLTLANLEKFLSAGMTAVPGGQFVSISLTITAVSDPVPVSVTQG